MSNGKKLSGEEKLVIENENNEDNEIETSQSSNKEVVNNTIFEEEDEEKSDERKERKSNRKVKKKKKKKKRGDPVVIFPDDLVISHPRKKKKRKRNIGWVFTRTGIVQSVGGELDQSDYESDSELEEEQVRVTFMNDQRDRVCSKNSVKIVDRSFSHGDVVKHVKDFPKGQAGVVKDVKVKLDVLYVNSCKNINHHSSQDHVVNNVPAQWLFRHPFQKKHLAVYKNRFVCYVRTVYFDVELVFRKGNDQKVLIKNVDPDIFFSEDENGRILDYSYPFRHQQTIKFSRYDRKKLEMLKNGEWLSGAKYEEKLHKIAKVWKVSPTKVDLRKIFMRPNVPASDEDSLDEFLLIPVEDIRPYQYFNYTKWGVGEFGFVNHPETKLRSVLSTTTSSRYDPSKYPHSFEYVCDEKYFRQLRHNSRLPIQYVDPSRFVRVVSQETFVDVHWQDGTVSKNLPSIELCPFSHVQTQDFYPGDTVRFIHENLQNEEEEEEEEKKMELGTIVSVDFEEKVCKVLGFHRKEAVEVSCFELDAEEAFHFDLGDVVVDLRVTMSPDNILVEKKTKDIGWTGQVIGLSPKYVEVFWHDTNRTSEIERNSLLNLTPLLEEVEDEENDSSDDDDDSDSESEEEGEDEEDGEIKKKKKKDSESNVPRHFSNESSSSSSDSTDSKEEKDDWVSMIKKKEQEEEEEEEEDVIIEECEIKSNNNTDVIKKEEQEHEHEREQEKFFIIPEFKFHKYQYKNNITQQSTPVSFLKRMGKEIRMFRKNRVLSTTKNIYVISAKNRMDLFRFIIFGSKRTPYYSSIFFFDVYLNPETYPSKPPKVKFYSKGIEINPNLYKDGKICLSLLGTWNGKERGENWIPGISNLFQIVQSIQTFILNEDPWFNEAGHDRFKTQKFDEQSRMFNYEAILNVIKQQTKQYNDLVSTGLGIGDDGVQKRILMDHLTKYGERMIKMVNGYASGEIENGEDDVLNIKKSSKGFERSLMKLTKRFEESIVKFMASTGKFGEEEHEEEVAMEKKDDDDQEEENEGELDKEDTSSELSVEL